MVLFQILLDGAEPCDAGMTWLSSPVCQRGGYQDALGTSAADVTSASGY